MLISLLAAMALEAQAGSAQPAPATSQAAPAVAPKAAAAANPITCRSEIETGSNFHKRICHTKTEWAQIEAADQDSFNVQQLKNQPSPYSGH
jgi:hypothetical protein